MPLAETERGPFVIVALEFLLGLRQLPAVEFLHAGRVRTAHKNLGEVVASPGLIEPKRGPAGGFAAMHEFTPVDVTEMAVGAALHEAHRYDAMCLPIRIDVLALVEPCAFHQRAAAVGLTVKLFGLIQLGHEPVGELRTADAAGTALAAGPDVMDRGFAQPEGAHLEALAQLGDQAWFIDLLRRLIRAIHPEVEAADHNGAIGQIRHGAWAIGGDQLAVAHLALGAAGRLARHQLTSPSPSGRWRISAALGSTSRRLQLARNSCSIALSSLRSGSSGVWSRGATSPASRPY